MTTQGHYRRTRRSRYEEGWEASIGENGTATSMLGTCPAGALTVSRDTTEDTETHGKDAALLALENQTAHRCDADCGGWELTDMRD
jgi:hypothetical protein